MRFKKGCSPFNKCLISGIFFILVLISPASAQDVTQADKDYNFYSEIAGGLMCLCGCGASIRDCPHKNCGFANPVKSDIKRFISQGQSKEQIVAFFVEKHGDKILTAPPKRGFNIVGYVLPGILIIVVGILIFFVITRWTSEGAIHSRILIEDEDDSSGENDLSYKERLEKELKDFDE